MGDTEHGTGAVRTKGGALLGDFAYVLTRLDTGKTYEYALQISDVQTAPRINLPPGEELTLDLAAGRKIRFEVQGGAPDAGSPRDALVLGPPAEATP